MAPLEIIEQLEGIGLRQTSQWLRGAVERFNVSENEPVMIAWPEQEAGGADLGDLTPRDGSFSLSLVVPLFNEEAALESFFERVLPILERTTPDYEIICVNDGSSDESLAKLKLAHLAHPRIKVVNLSRNFGKEAALTAGLDHASGDAVIPLDADLQELARVDSGTRREVAERVRSRHCGPRRPQ